MCVTSQITVQTYIPTTVGDRGVSALNYCLDWDK